MCRWERTTVNTEDVAWLYRCNCSKMHSVSFSVYSYSFEEVQVGLDQSKHKLENPFMFSLVQVYTVYSGVCRENGPRDRMELSHFSNSKR